MGLKWWEQTDTVASEAKATQQTAVKALDYLGEAQRTRREAKEQAEAEQGQWWKKYWREENQARLEGQAVQELKNASHALEMAGFGINQIPITWGNIQAQMNSGFTMAQQLVRQGQLQLRPQWEAEAGKEAEQWAKYQISLGETKWSDYSPAEQEAMIESWRSRILMERHPEVYGQPPAPREEPIKPKWYQKFIPTRKEALPEGYEMGKPEKFVRGMFQPSREERGIELGAKPEAKPEVKAEYPTPTMSLEQFEQQYFADKGWEYDPTIPRYITPVTELDPVASLKAQHITMAQEEYARTYGAKALIQSYLGDTASFLYAPARAIRPEVKWEEITPAEHVLGIGQIALYVIGPAAGAIPGVTGAITRTAAVGTAASAFTAHTAMTWDDMSPVQRVISVGFDVLFWAGFAWSAKGLSTDVKAAQDYYKTPLAKEMPDNLRGTAFEAKCKNLYVEACRVGRRGDLESLKRAEKLYQQIKDEIILKGYAPKGGWEPYTLAATGTPTAGNPTTTLIVRNVEKMKATQPSVTPPIAPAVAAVKPTAIPEKVTPVAPEVTGLYAKPPGRHEVPQFGEAGAVPEYTPSAEGRRRIIESRLKRGEPVSAKLLAEFPDLAKVAPEVAKPVGKVATEQAFKAGALIKVTENIPISPIELPDKGTSLFNKGWRYNQAEKTWYEPSGTVSEVVAETGTYTPETIAGVEDWLTSSEEVEALGAAKPPIKPPPPPSESPLFAGKPVGDPIAKLNELLKQAKPIRRKIETAYTAERAKRIAKVDEFIQDTIDKVGGEEGYKIILSKLKGTLLPPEGKIAFEPIKAKLSADELKALYIRTWKHPYLDNWEKISAADGLTDLLTGAIPQPKQLVLLEEIYGTDLIKNILSKRVWGAKAIDFAVEAMNVPRAILATADMSAFLRQGIIPVIAHPRIGAKAIGKTFQFALKPKIFEQYFKEDLPNDPLYALMRKSKLAITDPFKARMAGREEPFISRFLQKIPILRIPVTFAERSYVGFLNKVRVDLFKSWANEALSKGFSPIKDIEHFKAIATVVNTFTGRGAIGKLEGITPVLNTIFFSPRLISARFNALNPVWYAHMPKEIRKKAITDFALFVSAGLTTLALIKLSAGDEVGVETDPRSSDFGKIRIGNTRWDIWAGFQQWVRVFAQIITGERKNTTTGEIVSLNKDEYPFTTRKEVLLRFIEGKLAPVPALINELISGGKTFTGEDITFETVAREKFIPMYIQDIAEAYADGGLGRAVGAGIPAFFGVGVQTWGEKAKSKTSAILEFYAQGNYGKSWDDLTEGEKTALLNKYPELREG